MLTPTGLQFLDRRRFLAHLGSGLGGIALGAMLASESSAESGPILHHPAKAKRVVHIFCTGAVSHLDTWDYKPELIKRNGQKMPGVDKLVTFQGENGNLARSPWEFRPRGESGKMVSDLLPNLAELADEMCFVHSMTSKTNTHGPGEMFMSTGFTAEGFPSLGSWASYAAGHREPGFTRVRGHPRPSRRAAARPGKLVERLPAGHHAGHRLQRRSPHPQPGQAAGNLAGRRPRDQGFPPPAQ